MRLKNDQFYFNPKLGVMKFLGLGRGRFNFERYSRGPFGAFGNWIPVNQISYPMVDTSVFKPILPPQ